MAQHLSELCSLLVEDSYGNLASQIFETLAIYGRITLATIHYHTRLSVRHIKHGVTLLIQQHLVLLHSVDEDSPAYYQVNWEGAYNLIRCGKIAILVEDRHGEGAGHLVGNLLQLGHASIGDLAKAYDFSSTSKRDSGYHSVDGDGESTADSVTGAYVRKPEKKIASLSKFHSILRKLLRSGFISKVGSKTFTPVADVEREIEETVLREQFSDGRVTGPKKQVEFKAAVNDRKRKRREADDYSEFHDRASKGTIKRPGLSASGPNKRIKVDGDGPNGVSHRDAIDVVEIDEPTAMLPNDIVVCVNLSKCTVAFRSQHLQSQATKYLGHTTGKVYGALLQCLETKVRAVKDDLADYEESDDEELAQPAASVIELNEVLDPSLDLAAAIKGVSYGSNLTNGTSKKQAHVVDNDDDFTSIGIKRERHSDDEDDEPVLPKKNGFISYADNNKRLHLIELHLSLLQEHPRNFCDKAGNRGKSEWRVNFPALTQSLIEAEVDATITAKCGRIATRTCRLLREKGKLDEKQVAAFAMMRIKDSRSVLSILQSHGFVEAQELPKDNGRQPSRTLFFWYFDTHRVQLQVLHDSYKAMARALERIRVEKQRFKSVIEKAESSVLFGDDQEFLSPAEKNNLRAWKEVEEKLLTQVMRMDDTVALLRDFSGTAF